MCTMYMYIHIYTPIHIYVYIHVYCMYMVHVINLCYKFITLLYMCF